MKNCKYCNCRNMSAIVPLFVVWVILSQTTFAQTTPPHLPSPFYWDRTNIGEHWIAASSLEDIENAFNTARAWEMITLNDRTEYNTILDMDLTSVFTVEEWLNTPVSERALWLINDTRSARGLTPYEGIDPVLNDVATTYAEFLLNNDANGHSADGRNAFTRYIDHPLADESCPVYIQESLSYSGSMPDGQVSMFPIAVAIYSWVYTGTPGHRESILYQGDTFLDDTGVAGAEGNIGIGMVEGDDYNAFDGIFNGNTQIVVYNHHEIGRECDAIAPVPPDQNMVLINDINYNDTIGSVSSVEIHNSGTKSQSLRHYILSVGSRSIVLPTIALKPGEYTTICVNNNSINDCMYGSSWSDTVSSADTNVVTLLLGSNVVDVVSLNNLWQSDPPIPLSVKMSSNKAQHKSSTPLVFTTTFFLIFSSPFLVELH